MPEHYLPRLVFADTRQQVYVAWLNFIFDANLKIIIYLKLIRPLYQPGFQGKDMSVFH